MFSIKWINKVVYERGYAQAVRHHKKDMDDLIKLHSEELERKDFSHAIEIEAKTKSNKRLGDKLRGMKRSVKGAEDTRLVCKKERREIQTAVSLLSDMIHNFQNRSAEPLQEMLHMIGEIDHFQRRNKSIEG